MEEWRNIAGYEGFYQVSNYGRVKRLAGTPKCRTDRVLVPFLEASGYLGLVLSLNGKTHRFRLHRLVATAFLAKQPGCEVNHKNGCKFDNDPTNLEWVTRSANLRHRHNILGQRRDTHGTKNPNARLNTTAVAEIRRLYASGEYSQTVLAGKYSVCQAHISKIVLHKEWH